MRLLLIVLLLLPTSISSAQAVLGQGAQVRRARTSQYEPPGPRGWVDSVSGDSAVVDFLSPNRRLSPVTATVPVTELEMLVGERSLRRDWALIGALTGAVVGYVYGWRVGETCGNPGPCKPDRAIQLDITRWGAVLGAGIGGVLGGRHRVEHWVPVRP